MNTTDSRAKQVTEIGLEIVALEEQYRATPVTAAEARNAIREAIVERKAARRELFAAQEAAAAANA